MKATDMKHGEIVEKNMDREQRLRDGWWKCPHCGQWAWFKEAHLHGCHKKPQEKDVMTNATDMKYGEIVAVDRFGRQRVETDDGDIHWFTGVDRVKGGVVGDRVTLNYRIAAGAWGLWFASVDPALSCSCGRPSENGDTCMECRVAGSEN